MLFISDDTSSKVEPVNVKDLPTVSILPDWKSRFDRKDNSGTTTANINSKSDQDNITITDNEDDTSAWEDDDEPEALSSQNALELALQRNLMNIGIDLQHVDQNKLIELATKIMSGDGDAGDVMGSFVESLLEHEQDGHRQDSFASWLRQNASIANGGADEEEDMDLESQPGSSAKRDEDGEADGPIGSLDIQQPPSRKRRQSPPDTGPRKQQKRHP